MSEKIALNDKNVYYTFISKKFESMYAQIICATNIR